VKEKSDEVNPDEISRHALIAKVISLYGQQSISSPP
jgi:hypothetical protein